ncbi:MAG: hypothetical protein IT289_12695 [Oligoflexia bacterium]|nr:hypothetical protein [Oligoflexia bacterium]
MDYFEIKSNGNTFEIQGFPNAAKVIKIAGPKAKRLADLALHKNDLDFALSCLEQINNVSDKTFVVKQALWRSAIVHYVKCFGKSKARFSLQYAQIYKGQAEAKEPYKYFDSLRKKHLVHDENSYAQCLTGAILNKADASYKIEKIICLSVIGETLSQGNYSNLHLLISVAKKWVVADFDKLCVELTNDLESKPYSDLLSKEAITYVAPDQNDVHKLRPKEL